MKSDKAPRLKLVGATVAVKAQADTPAYFTPVHQQWIGKTGRVHAIVPGSTRDNPLVKVGFEGGTRIVFFRLHDLDVQPEELENPRHHGKRGSHLPQ